MLWRSRIPDSPKPALDRSNCRFSRCPVVLVANPSRQRPVALGTREAIHIKEAIAPCRLLHLSISLFCIDRIALICSISHSFAILKPSHSFLDITIIGHNQTHRKKKRPTQQHTVFDTRRSYQSPKSGSNSKQKCTARPRFPSSRRPERSPGDQAPSTEGPMAAVTPSWMPSSRTSPSRRPLRSRRSATRPRPLVM